MGKEQDDLENIIEQLRRQLYDEIAGKCDNISKKKTQKISAVLDKLIVQWAKDYPDGPRRKNPTEK